MSKEKTLRTLEETEVMQATGVPAQETEEVSTALATEIIADLKKQLEEAKEERNVRRMSSGSVRKLRQVCIIPTKI